MSHLSQTEKFVNSTHEKARKLKWGHKIVLLAIAREADRTNSPTASIRVDEDLIRQITHKEIIIQLEIIARKLLKLFCEGEIHESEVWNFLANYKNDYPEHAGDEALDQLHYMYKNIKNMSPKRKKQALQHAKKYLAIREN
jgi:hypothetical protein